MFFSRRIALLLALSIVAASAALAQSSSSSSNPTAPAQAQAGQPAEQSQGQMSVQARIRARRAQRRAAAIHEAYSHRYEEYTGMGYLRFEPGAKLERAHEYAWNIGVTRYFDERLGVTVDGRGYYGTAYTGISWTAGNPPVTTSNPYTNPAISQYAALAGPTYRFYVQPKYSISGRVLGGIEHGNFSANTGHSTAISTALGLWPDGYVFAASASIPVEYNLTPNIGLRVAPEYYVTGFGSTTQNSLGFTTGIVYRFGKQ
jgi:hypothetical protein